MSRSDWDEEMIAFGRSITPVVETWPEQWQQVLDDFAIEADRALLLVAADQLRQEMIDGIAEGLFPEEGESAEVPGMDHWYARARALFLNNAFAESTMRELLPIALKIGWLDDGEARELRGGPLADFMEGDDGDSGEDAGAEQALGGGATSAFEGPG